MSKLPTRIDPFPFNCAARVAKLEQALGICELARFTPR